MVHQSDGNPVISPEDVAGLLAAMRARMPWEIAQKALLSMGLPRSRGWEQTLEKILNAPVGHEEFLSLCRIYKEHIFFGEKSVSFYSLPQQSIDLIREKLAEIEPTAGPLAKAYPLPVSAEVLDTLAPAKPSLIAVEPDEDGVALVFSSIRQVLVREEISLSDLPPEMAGAFSDFSEVIGTKKLKLQSFDILWVPHEGNYVRTMIDCPRGVPQEGISFIHRCLEERVNDTFGISEFNSPLNLFPLIERLYRDKTQGNVVELAFNTRTASTKHEKMRRRGTCLRLELYHRAGMVALNGNISPYKISIEWPQSFGGIPTSPELSLHGRAEMTLAAAPVLATGVVRKCIGRLDFDAVQARLLSALSANASDAG